MELLAIEAIQLQDIADSLIEKSINEITSLYQALGGNDKVAKGSDLIETIKSSLQEAFTPSIAE